MSYYEKYIKYKIKYNNLKKEMKGGNNIDFEDFLKELIHNDKYNDKSSLFRYLNRKYESDKKSEDIYDFYISRIYVLCELLYDNLSETSKEKQIITIFSYATGYAIVELIFGAYLKYIHEEESKLIFIDPYDNIEFINNFGIFIEINNIFKELNLIESRLRIPNKNEKVKEYLNIFTFDIFISCNPQSHIYEEIPENKLNAFLSRENIMNEIEKNEYISYNNSRLKTILKLITYLSKNDNFTHNKMIWLLFDDDLDLTSKENLISSIKNILESEKYFEWDNKKWKIEPEYVFSSISNLNKIFRVPHI